MQEELNASLSREYPTFFTKMWAERRAIECDDGWFKLIGRMCEEVLKVDPHAYAAEIAEIDGELTVEAFCTEAADEVLDRFRLKSRKVCERCGDIAEMHDLNGWPSAVCDKHYAAWREQNAVPA